MVQVTKRLLNISRDGDPSCLRATGFKEALGEFGELVLLSGGDRMSEEEIAGHVRQCHVFLTGHGTTPLPKCLAEDRGSLEYICGITGTMRAYVPVELVDAGIPLTNWGDTPAQSVAEGAMTLLLATLKDLHHHIAEKRRGGWKIDRSSHGGSLDGLNVGVFGCGVIGRRFIELLRPFGAVIRVYDPYLSEPVEGVIVVESIDALFESSEAIVVHAGWTPETDKIINADRLAKLPDHGVIVNTARGGIIDQQALFRELESGRLRAGLDVLEPDWLPAEHPARQWENLILIAHQVGMGWPGRGGRMGRMHEVCLDNLRRWRDGLPLRFQLDPVRYRRST